LSKNFKSFNDRKSSLQDLADEISIKSLDLKKDDYLKLVIYETLRIEPPVVFSSSFMMAEDTEISDIKIKANDMLSANIQMLHHLEDQWGEDHNEFKPERFEGCGKHNPKSFMPFLASKRVWGGKTFAENALKIVASLILKGFPRIEFVDQD
jgi:cytochrome P450